MFRDTDSQTGSFVSREFDEPISERLQSHNVVSNEPSLYETFDYIRDETGAALGVGMDQMLDIAVNSQLDEVYIVDLLPDVVLTTRALLETGRKLHESLGRHATVQEYLDCFREPNITKTLGVIATEFSEHELSIIEGSFRQRIYKDDGAPLELDAPLQIEHYLRFKANQSDYRSWVSDDSALARVVSLYEQKKIMSVLGDLSGDHAMPSIAAGLKDRGVPVSIVYVSNAKAYIGRFGDNAREQTERFARNMDELPTSDSTIIISTSMGGRMPLPESVRRDRWMDMITQEWDYELQTVADRERERQRGFTYVSPDGEEHRLRGTHDRLYVVTHLNGSADIMDIRQPKPGLVLAGFGQRS